MPDGRPGKRNESSGPFVKCTSVRRGMLSCYAITSSTQFIVLNVKNSHIGFIRPLVGRDDGVELGIIPNIPCYTSAVFSLDWLVGLLGILQYCSESPFPPAATGSKPVLLAHAATQRKASGS